MNDKIDPKRDKALLLVRVAIQAVWDAGEAMFDVDEERENNTQMDFLNMVKDLRVVRKRLEAQHDNPTP